MNRWFSVAINAFSAALSALMPALTSAPLPPWVMPLVLVVNAGLHAIPEVPTPKP